MQISTAYLCSLPLASPCPRLVIHWSPLHCWVLTQAESLQCRFSSSSSLLLPSSISRVSVYKSLSNSFFLLTLFSFTLFVYSSSLHPHLLSIYKSLFFSGDELSGHFILFPWGFYLVLWFLVYYQPGINCNLPLDSQKYVDVLIFASQILSHYVSMCPRVSSKNQAYS